MTMIRTILATFATTALLMVAAPANADGTDGTGDVKPPIPPVFACWKGKPCPPPCEFKPGCNTAPDGTYVKVAGPVKCQVGKICLPSCDWKPGCNTRKR